MEEAAEGEYAAIFRSLPAVDFAFAYGSGVFKQAGYDDAHPDQHQQQQQQQQHQHYARLPMLDLVLAVTSPTEWHAANLQRNPGHYSVLRWLGAGTIARIQEDYGAALYYNTAVPVPGQPGRAMKYGVISTHALRRDLMDWTWIYAAGRMQKPTRVLKAYEPLAKPQRANLTGALRAALLLLPESFTDFQLFAAVASLSYRGDFRMTFGAENPRKVTNIVEGNLPHFHALYFGADPAVLAAVPSLQATGADRTRFAQDLHPATRAQLIDQLPGAVRRQLLLRKPAHQPWEALPVKKTTKMVKLAIHSVVARSSLAQGFKGVFTAGVLKAAAYAMRKVGKGLAGAKGGGTGGSGVIR